jgi:hypothetical protein
VSASAQEYKEKWQADQDIFNRTSTVINPDNCEEMEVFDCAGALEKRINPYRKGLVGNFRPYRSMVFYGSRKESDPAVATNIRVDGLLDQFQSYWLFDGNNNLVPDATAAKWVWNSQLTKVNAKGLELETQNALNIFTAAQYGYNKSVPVAITNNARYTEAGYEGFEDLSYNEKISGGVLNDCAQYRPLSFHTLANAGIVNTDTTGFNAHTGKYVLAVNKENTVTKRVSLTNGITDSFNLKFAKDTLRVLQSTGVNITQMITEPVNGFYTTLYEHDTEGGVHVFLDMSGSDSLTHTDGGLTEYTYNGIGAVSYYISIEVSGTYDFRTQVVEPDAGLMSFSLKKADGTEMPGGSMGGFSADATYTFCLPKGFYQVTSRVAASGLAQYEGGNLIYISPHHMQSMVYSISSPPPFRDLVKNATCVYSVPIAAKDSFLNATLTIPVGKKMLFSAWVREDCGNASGVPCTKLSYDSSQVIINGSPVPVTLKPAGAVIDGWQRYEGAFTVTGDYVDIQLINNSKKTAYYDDIRIHPYNANMKSYVYDPVNLRLTAELDANNYAIFYEYDEEGTLIRTKAETREGIKTITETRSSKQKKITTIQ